MTIGKKNWKFHKIIGLISSTRCRWKKRKIKVGVGSEKEEEEETVAYEETQEADQTKIKWGPWLNPGGEK